MQAICQVSLTPFQRVMQKVGVDKAELGEMEREFLGEMSDSEVDEEELNRCSDDEVDADFD